MTFAVDLRTQGRTTVIELRGDLDSLTAPRFRDKIQEADTDELDRLVLDMTRLNYLSSAGLRGLVFARQKMGDDVEIILVAANESVQETILLTGFHHSVSFTDQLPQ